MMPSIGARIFAYGFIGAFAIGSLVSLTIAVGSTVQRVSLLFSGSRTEGTVVAKKQVGYLRGGAAAYAPMLQFTASDGQTYVVTSDLSGPESMYRFGEHLRVLYKPAHPNGARIDAFAPLWTLPLVIGVVGTAFSIVPGFVIANWSRQRRVAKGEALQIDPDRTTGRGPRWALGVVLASGGLVLVCVGLRSLRSNPAVEAAVLGISVGVLLAASGVLVGQWVATGSRTYHALGGLVMTAMGVMFGWVSFFGEASGFSANAGVGATAVSLSAGVTSARIAFGIASALTGVASLWSWRQVLRRHG